MSEFKRNYCDDIPQVVFSILDELGVPRHVLGYKYLASSIYYVSEKIYSDVRYTKEVYPAIAKIFNTTPSRVERAIRHSIDFAFNSFIEEDVITKYFGNSIPPSFGKPTNSHFIYSLAFEVRKALLNSN